MLFLCKLFIWSSVADCYGLIGDEEKTMSVWKNITVELKADNAPQGLVEDAIKRSQTAVKK